MVGNDTGSDPSRKASRGISPAEADEIGRILDKVAKRAPGSDGIGIVDSDSPYRRRFAIIAAGLIIAISVVILSLCIGGGAA